MNRVVHFEIHADDVERAQKFYQEVFGWKMEHMGEEYGNYITIMTGPQMDNPDPKNPGINGGMMKRNAQKPAEGLSPIGYVCIIGVENIDETISKIIAAGGKEHLAKTEVPKVGLLAYYGDTEGNTFGILQPSPMPM